MDAYNCLGVIYFKVGNYPRAYDAFLNAEKLAEGSDKIDCQNNLASIYHYFNDNEKALFYLEKAINNALQAENRARVLSPALNIINIHLRNQEYDKAVPTITKLREADITPSPMRDYVLKTAEGVEFMIENETEKAIGSFRAAAALADSMGQNGYKISSLDNIAGVYMSINRYDSALGYADRILEMTKASNQMEATMAVYDMLSKCYGALGNHDRELEYKLAFINMKDSIFSAKEFGKVIDLQAANDINEVSQKLMESEYKRKNHETAMWFSMALLLLIAASATWIFIQNQRLKERLNALYQRTKEMTFGSVGMEEEPELDEEPIMQTPEGTMTENREKNQSQPISDQMASELKERILKELDENKLWRSPEFSLHELSRCVNSNPKYVSYVLNRHIGKSFSVLINDYRIREACILLADNSHASSWTIETIGHEVGFKSRSNFGATFKKVTGLTPKEFIVMMRNDKELTDGRIHGNR